MYYDLYNKYKSDYEIDKIFTGGVSEDISDRAKNAKFDERMALLGLLNDKITEQTSDVISKEEVVRSLIAIIKNIAFKISENNLPVSEIIDESIKNQREKWLYLKSQTHFQTRKILSLKE